MGRPAIWLHVGAGLQRRASDLPNGPLLRPWLAQAYPPRRPLLTNFSPFLQHQALSRLFAGAHAVGNTDAAESVAGEGQIVKFCSMGFDTLHP